MGMANRKVLGDLFEGFQRGPLAFGKGVHGVFKAVIDVILNQGAFGLAHGRFNGMKLLGDIHAFAAFLDHRDDAAQMAIGALESLDDGFVGLMYMTVGVGVLTHGRVLPKKSGRHPIPPGGIGQDLIEYGIAQRDCLCGFVS